MHHQKPQIPKKSISVASTDFDAGYEIGVTVLGAVGKTPGKGLILPGTSSTGRKQRLKAVIGFLSSRTEEVFATSSLSKEMFYTPSGALDASAKVEKATNEAFANRKDHRQFNATWEDSSLSFKSGLADKRSFKVCLAMADSENVSESVLAYPIGVSSIEIDLTSQNGIKIVDIPLKYLGNEDTSMKPIKVRIDQGRVEKRKGRKSIGQLVTSGFSFTKRKSWLKKQGRYQDASHGEEEALQLNDRPNEEMLVRLRIRVEKKDTGVEVSLQDTTVDLNDTMSDTSISLPEEETPSYFTGKAKKGASSGDVSPRTDKNMKNKKTDDILDQEENDTSQGSQTVKMGRHAPGLAYTSQNLQSGLCGALRNTFSADYDEETLGDTADMSSGILAPLSSVSVWSTSRHDDNGRFLELPKSLLACLPSYNDVLRAAERTADPEYECGLRKVPSLVEAGTFLSQGNQSLSMDPTLTMDSGIFSESKEPEMDIEETVSMLLERGPTAIARIQDDSIKILESEEKEDPQQETETIQANPLVESDVREYSAIPVRAESVPIDSESQKAVHNTVIQAAEEKTTHRKVSSVGAYDYTPIEMPALESSQHKPLAWRPTRSTASSPLTRAQKREAKSILRRLHSGPAKDSEALAAMYSEPQALDAAFDDTQFWKSVVY